MTVSTSESVIQYDGNGATVAFPVPFRFLANDDLVVIKTTTDGIEETLVLGTDYSVSGGGELSGGTVTASSAPASGEVLTISREMEAVQETDLRNQGKYLAQTHENVFDYLTMLIQQNAAGLSKAIRVAVSDPIPARLPPAASRSNMLMGFNSSGDPVPVSPVSGSASDLALQLLNAIDPAKGAAMIGYRGRTVRDRLDDIVNVLDYGADPTGATSSVAAFDAALAVLATTGGGLFVPSGDYLIDSPVDLPAADIDIYGEGACSRLFGSASALIRYPASVTNGAGAVVTQNIRNLMIEQAGDGIGVQMHQTWDPVGKFGPTIRDTVFLNSSPTTTAATCISISGVWSANIQGSYFFGKGAGGGPTTGIGGYGIRFSLTSNASSSSMNITISDNIFITIANAIYTDDRILVAGGRIEGLRIADNNIIAGQYGIRTAQVLALSISGNQISDFYIAILSIADFDVSITGNTEITGLYSGIVISADEDGITERYSITANNIGSNDICIRFSNVIADGVLRSITITANTFRGIVSTAKGVAVEGAYGVSGASVCANIFWSLAYGIWCGPSSDIVSSANQYYSVAVKVFGGTVQGIRSYSESRSITLTGGAATETINIAIPAGYFDSAPDSAYMTSNTDMITGFYNYDGSSATSLQFVVRRADGATISSVARRFSISAFDSGY